MAIKKQKRFIDESAAAGKVKSENGGGAKNKLDKRAKKIKLEKQPEPVSKPAGSLVIKTEEKPQVASLSRDAKKAAKLLKKNENRKEARKEQGQFKAATVNLSKEEIERKLQEIRGRENLTKTARRRLGVLKRKLAILEGTFVPGPQPQSAAVKSTGSVKLEKKKPETENKASNGSPGDSLRKNISNKPGQSPAGKKKAQKGGQNVKVIVKQQPAESDDDDEEEDDEEEDDKEVEEEEESDEEMDQSQVSTSNASEETDDDDDDDEAEEEEEDDEEEDDDEEEEEEKKVTKPVVPVKNIKKEIKTESPAKKQVRPEASSDGKKKRFVLFVGNLSFQATEDDIRKHFLTKVGAVENVRIPMKPGTKSPRGIAYVEFTNETDYQKGLTFHNTTINGRRINVEYTQGGSKSVGKRSEIVSKNKKLHAMRKGGMFGGKRDDRNDRRKKQKQT